MNKRPIALGSLTAAVVGVIAALAVAGVFDGGSSDGPGDGEQADSAALCIEGAEDCEDTIVIPGGNGDDGSETSSPLPAGSGDSSSATPLYPEPTQPILDSEADADRALATMAALAALNEMDVPFTDDIDVTEVRDVNWPNSCLGVEAPGIACAQVITPGFVIVINAGHGPYTFHADTNGNVVLAGLPR